VVCIEQKAGLNEKNIYFFLLTPSMKMEKTECSQTSIHKIQTPGIHPKEKYNIQNTVKVLNQKKIFCSRESKVGASACTRIANKGEVFGVAKEGT